MTGSLEGDVFHFNVGGMDYVGKVEGDRINPLQRSRLRLERAA